MKSSSLVASLCLSLLLACTGCNYVKPVMYVDIVNRSGQALENLEVKHPTERGPGQFGLPLLRDQQTHRHMIPTGTPCKFGVDFDDRSGKHYSNSFDLGAKCPTETVFEIGPGLSVSQRTAKP
jgi:hypothetical protein